MSLLSRLLSRATTAAKPHAPARPRLGVQQLEAREVPAVDFASALGLGNDAGHSAAQDVSVDTAGNSYLTGSFYGTLDFDPTRTQPGNADILTSAGDSDIFVAKYAPDDSLVWAVRLGGVGKDIGKSLDVDGSGNVCVAGQFGYVANVSGVTAAFGSTTLVSSGGFDGFVAKIGPGGAVQWAKRSGTAHIADDCRGVDTDAAGNVYATFTRLADANDRATWGYDIQKFNSAGALVWSKYLNTRDSPAWGNLVADAAGNVYLSGTFTGTVDFDPNAGRKLIDDGPSSFSGFILKLTSAGNFDWVGTLSGGGSFVDQMALDGSGNVIASGILYSGEASFTLTTSKKSTLWPTAISKTGAFALKLNSSGSFAWSQTVECSDGIDLGGTDAPIYGLTADAAGNVYLTGSFRGMIDLDPGAGVLTRRSVLRADGVTDSQDIFLIKLTSGGNLAWAETFGGSFNDVGRGVAVGPAGTIHLAGLYAGTVDFDPDPVDAFTLNNPTPYFHSFLVKLRQN